MTDQDQKFNAPSLLQGLVIFFVALGLSPLIALGADCAVKAYADEVYRPFHMGGVTLEDVSAARVLALLAENLASAFEHWTDFLIYLAILGLPYFVAFQLIAPRFFFNRPLAMAVAGLGLVPEDRRIIPGLTVEENLQLAQIAVGTVNNPSGLLRFGDNVFATSIGSGPAGVR